MSISDVIVVIEKKMRYVLESRRDEEYSEKKIIKIRPQIKNRQGGGQNHPPLGALPNMKDVGIPRVNAIRSMFLIPLLKMSRSSLVLRSGGRRFQRAEDCG